MPRECRHHQSPRAKGQRAPIVPRFWGPELTNALVTSRVSGRGNRIGSVCVCVCDLIYTRFIYSQLHTEYSNSTRCTYGLCVRIHHGERTLGQRNFTTRVAGGVSTLRRFHFKMRLFQIAFEYNVFLQAVLKQFSRAMVLQKIPDYKMFDDM